MIAQGRPKPSTAEEASSPQVARMQAELIASANENKRLRLRLRDARVEQFDQEAGQIARAAGGGAAASSAHQGPAPRAPALVSNTGQTAQRHWRATGASARQGAWAFRNPCGGDPNGIQPHEEFGEIVFGDYSRDGIVDVDKWWEWQDSWSPEVSGSPPVAAIGIGRGIRT